MYTQNAQSQKDTFCFDLSLKSSLLELPPLCFQDFLCVIENRKWLIFILFVTINN